MHLGHQGPRALTVVITYVQNTPRNVKEANTVTKEETALSACAECAPGDETYTLGSREGGVACSQRTLCSSFLEGVGFPYLSCWPLRTRQRRKHWQCGVQV